MGSPAPLATHLPDLAGCAAGILLCLRVWRVLPLPASRRSARELVAGPAEAAGVATLDFLLTFPFFLMIVLVVIQFAILVNARIVVSWAAFAAARSAVVWTDGGLEEATRRAQAAAAVACTAISPASGLWAPDPAAILLAVRSPGERLPHRSLRVAGMHGYALSATEAVITTGDAGGEPRQLGPHDPVTVTVTHQFHLAVPYADGLFSRAFGGWHRGLRVMPIRESYTLSNEGKVRTEGLSGRGECPYFDLSPQAILGAIRGLR